MPHDLGGNGAEEGRRERETINAVISILFGFEEGGNATEISTAIKLTAAAARERGPELGFITFTLDVKQAFDNVSLENLSLVICRIWKLLLLWLEQY